MGIRSRKEWYRHKMGRKQLVMVGISGQRVQADGGREMLVEGQEVWPSGRNGQDKASWSWDEMWTWKHMTPF